MGRGQVNFRGRSGPERNGIKVEKATFVQSCEITGEISGLADTRWPTYSTLDNNSDDVPLSLHIHRAQYTRGIAAVGRGR